MIGNMVRHNLAAIRYRNFDFVIGVYPNDEPTITAVRQLSGAFPNVHVAVCPHPGPTSKADCLNTIYARMEQLERESGVRFETVVLHDAEDIIHPDSLDVINRAAAEYHMIQVPVLPLKAQWREITHAIYCDEFAEFQTIDMRARQFSGAFLPSNGVGTGFARDVLVRLAEMQDGEVFDPGILTEDYEIGMRVHQLGYSQHFVPLRYTEKSWMATREFFPRKMKAAVRQRTRWVTGIGLQCWQRAGWAGKPGTKYWFWRDRKGLITHPLSLLANIVFVAGLLYSGVSLAAHRTWHLAATNPAVLRLCSATLGLQILRLGLRMACVARIYGLAFAAAVPLRVFHTNLVNSCAALRALQQYARARRTGSRLAWQKTEHVYPSRAALSFERRELLAVLMDCGALTEDTADGMRRSGSIYPEPERFLLEGGYVSEDLLCLALSLQSGVQAMRLDIRCVEPRVVRSLPAYIQRRFGLVPFDMRNGTLTLAGWRVPSPEIFEQLKSLTDLELDFRLVPNSDYQALCRML